MPTKRAPRKGSLQYWPRKRAKRQHARVRKKVTSSGLAGFAGIKAGMTQVLITDNRKNSITKGQDISIPVTLIECPPLNIVGIRFYGKSLTGYGTEAKTEVHFEPTKHLAKSGFKKAGSLDKIKTEDYEMATVLVATNPAETGIGQKKPHVFEMGFGGSIEEAITFVKETKQLTVDQILKPGQFYDAHAVTTGRGFQGAVKRFGIGLRSHKSEKSVRKAVLGPEGYGKVSYTSIQAGQMGYHLRTEYNKQIIAIMQPEEVQAKGGFVRYGVVKNPVVLVKGSIAGPKKRLITLTEPLRADPKASTEAMAVTFVAQRSQQGNI